MRALAAVIRHLSAVQPPGWLAVAARQLAQVPDLQLHHFLTQDYEVLRMLLPNLVDDGVLGTVRELLNSLLQPVQQ
jgi:hypothetical protein